jgi:hypothetical protein
VPSYVTVTGLPLASYVRERDGSCLIIISKDKGTVPVCICYFVFVIFIYLIYDPTYYDSYACNNQFKTTDALTLCRIEFNIVGWGL